MPIEKFRQKSGADLSIDTGFFEASGRLKTAAQATKVVDSECT
jgi:hypothetical protein